MIKPHPPQLPAGFTWRDYLISSLHTAAGLEHQLMVEYLYAAYSLGGEHLNPDEQKRARWWQDNLLAVAKEEMGHLLTVQNVLCFVGGPVCFDRDVQRGDAPFPFGLEPLSSQSISRYLRGEMPEQAKFQLSPQISQADVAMVEKWIEQGEKSQGAGPPVGKLYELLVWILARPDLVPDSEFRPETYAFQASWDDWGRGYRPAPERPDGSQAVPGDDGDSPLVRAEVLIDRVATRTEAVAALSNLAKQGENPTINGSKLAEDSHFVHFLNLRLGFERANGAKLVRRVPVNPTTEDDAHRSPGSTRITATYSLKWATLFNLRYRLLLAYLTHTFRHARVVHAPKPNTRGLLMHRVFGEMYNIKALSGLLVRMPLTDDPTDQGPEGSRAGPPFELPYTLSLPLDDTDCWKQYRDMLLAAREICTSLLESDAEGKPIGPREGAVYLRSLLQLDRQTLAWVDGILAGLHPSLGTRS